MQLHHIGLVVHSGRPVAVDAARRVRAWSSQRQCTVRELDVWRDASGDAVAEEEGPAPDVVVSIGGDGTFLRAARAAAMWDVPVLGVDVGRLGFLTEVAPQDVEAALDRVCAGEAEIENRMALGLVASRPLSVPAGLEAMLNYGGEPASPVRPAASGGLASGSALDEVVVNDIVVEKLTRDRQANLGVHLGGRLFARYSADGVMVATPTGSTAYSFAAGGPIVSPQLDALIVTPVAAHMVFNRSLVLAPEELVGIQVLEGGSRVAVTLDGRLRGVLDPGDVITVGRSRRRLRLLRLDRADFYSRMRAKFSLADAGAAAARA